jgi:hypothetical protein
MLSSKSMDSFLTIGPIGSLDYLTLERGNDTHNVTMTCSFFSDWGSCADQGCQIFLGTIYQKRKKIPNGGKYTEWP